MKALVERLARLDRRTIYLIVAIAIILPLLMPLGLPLVVSKQVRDFHQAIENIADGSTVIVAMDYDPTAMPELHPMNIAVLRHLFSTRPDGGQRHLKVVALSLFPAGPPLARRALDEVADREFHKEYGVDYVNLGYKEGREIVMAGMGIDIHQVWPTDIDQRKIGTLPMMRGIKNYENVAALISVSAGYPGLKEWVQQAQSIFGVKMVGGATGVSAPEYYPYYQSGQLLGLLEGLKGAAEYEKLIGYKGKATSGMDAQSTGHWVIALFIVLGNLVYFVSGRKS